MGAAIEVFEGARTIEVGRDRFVPVKTTNDLLVLRSDVYDLGKDFVLDQAADELPFVDLDRDFYKLSATSTSASPRVPPRCARRRRSRSRATGPSAAASRSWATSPWRPAASGSGGRPVASFGA